MSIFEYDKEEEEKKLRKAEYEAGREKGEREGIRLTIYHFLSDYGTIPEELKTFLSQEQNEEKLFEWSKMAAGVRSIKEFQQKIQM